jgi:hypothetical protein
MPVPADAAILALALEHEDEEDERWDRTTHTEATNTAPTRTTVRSLFRWDRPIPTPRPHSAPGLRTVGTSTDSEALLGHVSLVFPRPPLSREVAVSYEGAGGCAGRPTLQNEKSCGYTRS